MSDLTIHPVYLSARAAIVAPERAIPVSLYATQKWLPRLGPERWCLVMVLRSLSIDSKRRSDGTKRVSVSWRQLAEMLDVHEETVASWLKHEPIPQDKPWRRIIQADDKAKNLSLFIPRLRYAYETQNGKTRRIGFLLEILMEDPVVQEDEYRLQKQIELMQFQQGTLGLETYRITVNVNSETANLPQISPAVPTPENSGSLYVNSTDPALRLQANSPQLDLHNSVVNPSFSNSPALVKQNNAELGSYVNQHYGDLRQAKSGKFQRNVNELDILIQQLKKQNTGKKNLRKDSLLPIIELTENLLNDKHSRGMFIKALDAFYPNHLDLYVTAIRIAIEAENDLADVNLGAVFVRTIRELAEVVGIDLGINRPGAENSQNDFATGNPGSQSISETKMSILTPPSIADAIWSETQLVLRRQMTQATYDAIIQGTILIEQSDNKYLIGVRSEMAKEWLENRLRDIVQRALSITVGKPVNIEFKLIS